MKLRPLLLSCFIGFTLAACEKVETPAEENADADLVKVSVETAIPSTKYDEKGLVFDYPSEWKVLEDSVQDSVRYVFIESPDEALSIIQIFRKDEAPTLEEFAYSYAQQTQMTPVDTDDEVVDVEPSAVPQSEFMAITRDLDGVSYDWIVETIPAVTSGLNDDSNDYREYFRKDSEHYSAFLINQVDKDALNKHEGSFELIFRTLQPMK
ncbi:MAG: hypothetical protein CSB47_10310 [Proteobacteria bacterium]|nr:MAG: hypothetical protein CSB47_10310 [Pseudomonadota bacterium]